LETVFDVSFPNSGYTCLGTNHLKRKAVERPQEKEPGITGVGGVFFRSERPEELRQWYSSHLNLVTDAYGAVFEFRNANDPDRINYLRWSAFEEASTYFTPSEKPFMINYRVRHLEEMVRELTASGITILDQIEEYEYGKFVHLMDPEGNKVELWEPKDQFFTEMGGPTNK
jgi:predicted enzyme related to lactoylglutathione lyase